MLTDQECSPTIALAMALIKRDSVTPQDKGCGPLMMDRLAAMGFRVEEMRFGEVTNFWARLGDQSPLLCFAGHTDVVPPGPLEQWAHPPFAPVVENAILHGRGSADMKGSLAAMVTACERYLAELDSRGGQPAGSIAFLITSDEEGAAVNGTRKVIEVLEERNEKIDFCVVGEPSSNQRAGDVIKVGRRGSLHGRLRFKGTQGHIAYPHLADNPVHFGLAPLQALCAEMWDAGNQAFPPTSFQISNISAGTGTDNVIPGALDVTFNFRFSTASTAAGLQQRVADILARHTTKFELEWNLSGEPFLTQPGRLIEIARQVIRKVNGVDAETSTSGGTSDGRFIAPAGAQLIELGPCNATIHKVNEQVSVQDLEEVSQMYEGILQGLLSPSETR